MVINKDDKFLHQNQFKSQLQYKNIVEIYLRYKLHFAPVLQRTNIIEVVALELVSIAAANEIPLIHVICVL